MMLNTRQLLSLFCLALVAHETVSLNFLCYAPRFGRSRASFMGKLIKALIEEGHNVTVIAPTVIKEINYKGTIPSKADLIEVPQCETSSKFEKESDIQKQIWATKNPLDMISMFGQIRGMWIDQCKATLKHPGLLDTLRKKKFDAAFGDLVDFCGLGIFHLLGIEKTAITLSVASFEGSFYLTGAPSVPSYVPGSMGDFSDQMTFKERAINTASLVMMKILMPYFFAPYVPIFGELDPEFPSIESVAARTSLFFLNNEPLIDFPRPITHKIVDIGGLGMSTDHKPLNKTFNDIFALRPKTVLLSFGSVALSHLMPDQYKHSIRETFRKFPDVTFIWKYEKPEDNIGEGIENIVPVTWVPQNDMLYDPRLSLFITHCGAASTMEAVFAGVPLIVIPVMGDQKRNAQIIRRTGSGLVLQKHELETEQPLEEALREVLSNNKYAEAARRTSKMVASRPFSPRETFVRNMEFIARFGPLDQFDHFGRQLSFVQYYLLDVIAAVLGGLLLLLTAIFFSARFVIRRTLSFFCRGKDKKKSE